MNLGGALIAFLCLISLTGNAHESRPLYFELTEREAGQYELRWRFPESLRRSEVPSTELLACQSSDPVTQSSVGWTLFKCPMPPQSLKLTFSEGNPSLSTVVRFERRGYAPLVLQAPPGDDEIALPEAIAEGQWWSGYLELGMRHIAGGIDHLLFLICLMLLIRDARRLLIAITGFTLAHSVTLGLSSLGVLVLPVPWIEALIALSIVALAAELVTPDRDSWGKRYPLAISSAFGLLHGLGFAAALREMGLPSSEQLTALLAFNLGVEIGQVLFVVSAGLLIWVGHQLPIRVERWSQFFPKAVGVLASFWFFQRIILGIS